MSETPSGPRPTNSVYISTGPTALYAVVCEVFPREPRWCPDLPPATHAPRSWAHPALIPRLSSPMGANDRGQALWHDHPGTPLLLLVITTRGDLERVLRAGPTNLYGASPVLHPPLPAPEAWDGVHALLRTQEVTAVTGFHLVRLPPAPPDNARGPRALSPAQVWDLSRNVCAEWLARLPPDCWWMATGC